MTFLGETSSQTIVNSTLGFIFWNGSIVHNDNGVYFKASTPVPIQVPNACDFQTLKSRIHNILQLTDKQYLSNFYWFSLCFFSTLLSSFRLVLFHIESILFEYSFRRGENNILFLKIFIFFIKRIIKCFPKSNKSYSKSVFMFKEYYFLRLLLNCKNLVK